MFICVLRSGWGLILKEWSLLDTGAMTLDRCPAVVYGRAASKAGWGTVAMKSLYTQVAWNNMLSAVCTADPNSPCITWHVFLQLCCIIGILLLAFRIPFSGGHEDIGCYFLIKWVINFPDVFISVWASWVCTHVFSSATQVTLLRDMLA